MLSDVKQNLTVWLSALEHVTFMFGLDGEKNAGLDLGLFNLLCICSYLRGMKNTPTVSFRVFQNFCCNELERNIFL